MSPLALQLRRVLIATALLLAACTRGQPRPTTPPPQPTAAEVPEPRTPRVSITLGTDGATFTVDSGCVTIAQRELCDDGTLDVATLGGQLLEGGWLIPATAFAIEGAEVTLSLDEGIEPLGPRDGEPSAYLRPGDHTHRLREIGWVVLPPDDLTPTPETRLDEYQRAAVAVEAWLGEPRRRVLLSDAGEAGIPMTQDDPLPALIQAWLADAPEWWTRGLADYLALLIEHQAGALPSELAYDELLDRYTRHRQRPGESPPTAEGSAAADVGALVAFCVDVELRTRSTSLVEALRQSGEGPLDPERLLARIAHDHPEIATRHRGRSARRGVIELDGCLRRGGRKLIAHHVPLADPARLVRVGALDPDTAEVRERGPGPLRPGDIIRHVRGRAIRRAWDIVFYLRDLGGRHRFSVSVQRGEETIRTWLRMVAVDDELPTRVRFTAVEDPEADNEGDPFRGPVDDRQ